MKSTRIYMNLRFYGAVLLIAFFILFSNFCTGNKVGKGETPEDKTGSRTEHFQVDGTTGTPLGGVGTGAVKYCAWTGIINAFTDMTPAGMQRYNKHVTLGANACFQFYSNRGGTKVTRDTLKVPQVNGHFDDDAIFPIHRANYGTINNVSVSMIGFCPWDPSDLKKMSLPYAFYEFTVSNNFETPVDVAVAFRIKFEANPVFVKGKGLADDSGMHMKAIFAESSDVSPVITVGRDAGFSSSGQCNNKIIDATNKVAVKISLGAKETKTIKFVLSWFKVNTFGKYYYENLSANASSVADAGLASFDSFKNNAVSLVEGMRNSNLPKWTTNYLLNTLSNMVNNSVYTKDGRAAMSEGEFIILGTIDEYWQGRTIIGSNLMPEFTWKELEYWGRTQFRDPYLGQIHHGFGAKGKGISDEDLCGWDDYNHADYRPVEDIISWPDVNVGFIIGAYETFIATDNQAKLSLLWPYLKNTGSRLIAQKDQYGDPKNPWAFETSHNMYDAGGYCQTYSTGTVIPAYKCMALLAEIMNEPETKEFYNNAAEETSKAFERKYLGSDYAYLDKHCEGALAGPWFSQNLKFDQFDPAKVDHYLYDDIERYYKPVTDSMGYPDGTYNEWPQHIVGHLGGYAVQRSKFDPALALWKDMYNRGYLDRNRVFNLPISLKSKATPNFAATDIDGYLQYTSRPSTWRIYQDLIGYYRNKHTGEVWLEPILLPEMDHRLTDGYFISAEGNGTICCEENGRTFEDRTITFKPDNAIQVKGIYIKDHTGSPVIKVNGISQTWIRTGPEWKKRIRINWNGTANKNGVIVDVTGGL